MEVKNNPHFTTKDFYRTFGNVLFTVLLHLITWFTIFDVATNNNKQ